MSRGIVNQDMRYKIFYEKSDRYGDILGFSFEIGYNDWIYGVANYSKNTGVSHLESGIEIDKVINLSNLKDNITSIENSTIKGIVYEDKNVNGKYDKNLDKPLPNTKVIVQGRVVYTNEKGEYRITNLLPTIEYKLKIETQNPLYKSKVDVYKVNLNPVTSLELNLPVYTRKMIYGKIDFEDMKNREKYLKTLYMKIIDKKQNKVLKVIIPENDGFYLIDNLMSGEYLIKLESAENPEEVLSIKELEIKEEMKEMNLDFKVEGNKNEKKLVFNTVVISSN